MPTFASSGSGKWHVVGPDGCWFGQEFDDEDATPDETATATDIVAYEPPEEEYDRGMDTVVDDENARRERGTV